MINLKKHPILVKSRLIKQVNSKSLVATIFDNGQVHQYVVCSFYDPTKKFGSQWDWGHYFSRNDYAKAYECLLKLGKE